MERRYQQSSPLNFMKLFGKLIIAQLTKKFPNFHGTQKFVIVFIGIRHYFISLTSLN
jgi:hypothetical protein